MGPKILETRVVAGRTIAAVIGDLTAERVDAIVNAANSQLSHGGGLAGAIVRRGGDVIQQESSRLAPVAVGAAVSTGAGALPSRWVIHAVGPRWGEGDEEAKLRAAVRACLAEADRLGAASVSVPAISTGIFGYPKRAGTQVITDEACRWLVEHGESSLVEVRLTAFDNETATLFAEAVRGLP